MNDFCWVTGLLFVDVFDTTEDGEDSTEEVIEDTVEEFTDDVICGAEFKTSLVDDVLLEIVEETTSETMEESAFELNSEI